MNLISTFIIALARILNLAILVRILLSWIPMGGSNPIVTFIYEITEPILGPVRRLIPPLGGLDISPMIALILIEIMERVLLTIVARVG
jgi:YggT family protein